MRMLKTVAIGTLLILFTLAGCKLEDTVSSNGNNQHQSQYKLFINEFMASNDACCADENGEFDDWIELYNAGDDTVNLAGFYLSDDKSSPKKSQLPTNANIKIAPKGFIVMWADKQPDQGTLHLAFRLSHNGQDIVLTDPDGFTTVDEYTYGPQESDISMGRVPDGGSEWKKFTTPTPGASNTAVVPQVPPQISDITVSPDSINAGDMVTISAKVKDDDGDLASVKLHYGPKDSLNTTIAMSAQNDYIYQSQIGPFDDGTRVFFFITAKDAKENSTVSDTLSFEVGYIAPVLFINEFMASNDSCCTDEHGEYDDWIEIYNPGTDPVNIGGMHITDDLSDLTAWQIPSTAPNSTTIPGGGFLVLWADKQPDQGVLHVNIKLSSKGEQIGLTAPNGTTVIDSLTFDAQTTDVSMGRLPDGSDHWEFFNSPTPGASNHQ